MPRVLITGASGMVGRAMLDRLASADGYEITAVTSGRSGIQFPGTVRTVGADLLDPAAPEHLLKAERPQILLHLAWAQDSGDFRASGSNIAWLEASTRLLRAFVANGGERFLFTGTSAEYDDFSGKREEQPEEQMMSLYGVCKRAFSEIMRNYCARCGIQCVDARLFTIYGEYDRHWFGAIPGTVCALLRDEPVTCLHPNTVRDYVYVRDAAKILEALLGSGFCGVMNVASGLPRTMRDVFGAIARELGKEELVTYQEAAPCESILVGDPGVMKRALSMSADTPFEVGIRNTVQWWLRQNQKSIN